MSVKEVAKTKEMKPVTMRKRTEDTRKQKKSPLGMYPIIRYPNQNGGGMLEMERPWDVDEIKVIVGDVTDRKRCRKV